MDEQLPVILSSFQRLSEVAEAKREARRQEEEIRRAEQQRLEATRHRAAALQTELKRREDETNACREALHQQARRWEEIQRLQAYLAWLDQEQATNKTYQGEEYPLWRA
ncbi:hypothetical protein K7W42_17760 [Deinococcus sp. HMF7604]|uniref:hypothetical protein n=1 Tax=Deinococcus betulae TaxID=2873312 RepID=UPI001CCC17B3|nr:hypothetical protein [Deinococcus betulae]MBZ9752692.1 hypothetical protein [Deinococcus betulae]